MTRVRVALPQHLKTLASVRGELEFDLGEEEPTIGCVIDALEARYPMLKGTVREHGADRRRAFMRVFGGGEDLSHVPLDTPVPASVASGKDPLQIVGAIAGG